MAQSIFFFLSLYIMINVVVSLDSFHMTERLPNKFTVILFKIILYLWLCEDFMVALLCIHAATIGLWWKSGKSSFVGKKPKKYFLEELTRKDCVYMVTINELSVMNIRLKFVYCFEQLPQPCVFDSCIQFYWMGNQCISCFPLWKIGPVLVWL